MDQPTGLTQMNGYGDIEMIQIKENFKVLRATESVAAVFAEVRLSGKAGWTCGLNENNVFIF